MSAQTRTSYTYIDADPLMKRLVTRMKQAPRIALDTEADSLHHYFEKVCLIQLTLGEEHYVVDPLAGLDLVNFLSVLASKPLVLHGADYDLRILHASFGFRPQKGMVDTMLAAQLLGHEQLGLAALVQRFHDVTLIKQNQRFDWSVRPLPEAQLMYASDDTRFLPSLVDRLETELQQLGRTGWLREACDALVEVTCRKRLEPDPEVVWRIKGSSRLPRKQLAILRQVWHWREKEARKADIPPFKIVGNDTLLQLAEWGAAHAKQRLESGPKLPRNLKGRRFFELARAVNRGRSLKREDWPRLRKRNANRRLDLDMKRLDSLRNACTVKAKELGIAPSTLAPRAAIEAVVEHQPRTAEAILSCTNLVPWQAGLIEEIMSEL